MRKMVIAGGMGSGKTSLINKLRSEGFSVVKEAETALNNEGFNPDINPDFYSKVFDLQLRLESEVRPSRGDFVFLDRSAIDLFAFLRIRSFFGKQFVSPVGLDDYSPDFDSVFFINGVADIGSSIMMARFNKSDYINFSSIIHHDTGSNFVDYPGRKNDGYHLYVLEPGSTDVLYAKLSKILNFDAC